jgi:hypothetical protein
MTLFGAVRPTFRYPRLVWNGITIDFGDPAQTVDPTELTAVASAAITGLGQRTVLYERSERYVTVVSTVMEAVDCPLMERFFAEWANLGKQFELYTDRILRAWWGFDDQTTYDNNRGNQVLLGNAVDTPFTYAAMARGQGLVLPGSGVMRAALLCGLPGGNGNAFVGPDEGTLVLQFKPSWAANDNAEHVLLDVYADTARWKNRLRLVKRVDNLLHFVYVDRNGAETIIEAVPVWGANTEHTIIAQWKALADLSFKLDGVLVNTKKYPLVAGGGVIAGNGVIAGTVSGVANGVETTMNASPDTMAMGTYGDGQGGRGSGTYGMLALYSAALGLPTLWTTYEHPWRSYIPKAELVDATYHAARPISGRELYQYNLRVREGR